MSKVRFLKVRTENSWEYFTSSKGGSSRQWVKRYTEMVNTYRTLRKTGAGGEYLRGFKDCLDIFHSVDNILCKDKVKDNECNPL